jgi:hypothetical protein
MNGREFAVKNMSNLNKRSWIMGLAVFAITAASYAQWSDPAADVPAYHSSPLPH